MADSEDNLRQWRLPRGRHGLPREIVTRSQRERLLAAVVRVIAVKGYEATTVADILGEAGVGRESFYELFEDKRHCMLTAHALLIDDLETQVRAAYTAPGPWLDRVREGLAVALDWFAADPAVGRFTLIEVTAVGPASLARFEADFNRFIGMVEEGLGEGGPPPDLPRASSLAVSGTLARIYEEVVHDRTAELPSLLPELTFELLVPFVGEEAAREQELRAAATGGPGPRAGR
ncbi:MAG: TetR/AcrR family transcriptional regulator [Solirubrobacterales bacterium]